MKQEQKDEMLSVAYAILGDSRVLYLSHPITTGGRAIEDNTKRAAGYAAMLRREWGIPVVNPADVQQPLWGCGHQWMSFWLEFISRHVRKMALAPDWETSEGCRKEAALAEKLGIDTFVLKGEPSEFS